MPLIPLYGHDGLRRRIRHAVARQALPASLLIQGPRGVGKQRLALWIGQLLLCTAPSDRPCGTCTACRYALDVVHPDLHWFYPRPRLSEADPELETVLDDYAQATAERVQSHGLYPPASGMQAIYVAVVRAIVQIASRTPALGRRKVIIVGEAERMVPQEGSEHAANAFLKLLEEPPVDTTIVLTSSEPGALLPTVRSRVVALRAAPLGERDVRAFLADPAVARALAAADLPSDERERVRLAGGAPGALLGDAAHGEAVAAARRLLAAATAPRADRLRTLLALGPGGARGAFADTLDALTGLLHERVRAAVAREDVAGASGATRAIDAVEQIKLRASGNVSPQLLGAALVRQLEECLT